MSEQDGKRSRADVWRPGSVARPGGARWIADASQFVRSLSAWLRDQLATEVALAQLLPWVAVAFGAGVTLYFTAEREPSVYAGGTVAAVLVVAALVSRATRAFPMLVLLAAAATGFATASLKTARVAHEVLAKPLPSVALKGFVETHEERERTDRFVLRITDMADTRGAPKLTRVRLSVRKGTAPDVGSFVTLKARLSPPLAPLRPGSYDFSRDLYFQGIGASGFVMGTIARSPPSEASDWRLRYAAAMQAMRDAIDARIRGTLNGDTRAIATALLTGRRDAISTPVNDALFISGLGHVLSISGYHMAVVAGVVFFAVRALLALIPVLTVSFPIKKWAAATALVAATFYLLLSGAEVATQRSYFMTAVVLIAIMADRRAITFRTLALAALIVLAIAPEAVVHPSFQMSFAATLGLVALVQVGMPTLFAAPDHTRTARAALWGVRELTMLALASMIAGLATTPYAAFHFHRITPYGVIANVAAMPVVSALVMPAGLLGLVAIPFGFDAVFWRLMDFGIGWMITVSQWVAALPGAVGRMSAFGIGPLLLSSGGVIMLGLLRTPLRWSGAAVICGAIAWACLAPQPDVLIATDGHAVGVRGRDGRLRIMRTSKDAFLVKEWLAGDADARLSTDSALTDGVSCDDEGCVVALGDGRLVALAMRPDAFADDCARAAIIVTEKQPPAGCAAMVIDAERLQNSAGLSLRRSGDRFVTDETRPGGTDRPWSPASRSPAATAQGDPPASRRPIDATPVEADREADD